jgi:hypothetical protein
MLIRRLYTFRRRDHWSGPREQSGSRNFKSRPLVWNRVHRQTQSNRPYSKKARVCGPSCGCCGRGEWIRTTDPSVPNRVLYQAEPRPDAKREGVFYSE